MHGKKFKSTYHQRGYPFDLQIVKYLLYGCRKKSVELVLIPFGDITGMLICYF